jgi:hypothetical protein
MTFWLSIEWILSLVDVILFYSFLFQGINEDDEKDGVNDVFQEGNIDDAKF